MSTALCTECGGPLADSWCQGQCPACLARSLLGGEETPAEVQLEPGDEYELVRMIGHGGMGRVYLARQRSLGRMVAMKTLHGGLVAGEREKSRFLREARIISGLEHPNIVSVYDASEADGQAFFTMRWAEGGSLAERLKAGGRLEPRAAVAVLLPVVWAVEFAHGRGVLHRDLKASNILFSKSGEPMVGDFGLAMVAENAQRLTGSDVVLGTPSYVAPELAKGDVPDVRSDVYSLGVVLYECLTGELPFSGNTLMATLRAVIEDEPVPPNAKAPVDGDLNAIVLKCLEKPPGRRYATAAALAEDLARWQKGEPVMARAPGRLTRTFRWLQRRKAAVIAAAAVLLGLGGIGIALWERQARGNSSSAGNTTAGVENSNQGVPITSSYKLTLVSEGGAMEPGNLALTAKAFARNVIPHEPHAIALLNDGKFGNAHSWIAGRADTFAGLSMGAEPVTLGRIAFGRDNEGFYEDRAMGIYVLQFTTVPHPDENTPDQSWRTLGSLVYERNPGGKFSNMALRHVFSFTPVQATGIRLKINTVGGIADTAGIDELEVYPPQ